MNMNFLIGPVTGAIIGGITNSIAIRMLFRPIHPVKIGAFTLPFTPGVIPKEKGRIARKVGEVIRDELLNEEILREWLLKEEVYTQIERAIEGYFRAYADDETTLSDKLGAIVGKERGMYYVCELEEQITDKLYTKVVSLQIGRVVKDKILEAYKAGRFASLLGPMSFFINDSLVEGISQKIEPFINRLIEEEGESVIRKVVEDESSAFLNQSVKECALKVQKYEEIIKKSALSVYEKIVTTHLTQILKTLDLAKIVEERILMLDALELEKMILSIMKKELSAIVWFGVLLGAIMGCIMNFV